MENKFIRVDEVAKELEVSKPYAYKLIRKLNEEQYKFDESNGLWYELQGDYYLPLLAQSPQEDKPIGIWGQRHLRYIRQNKRTLYTSLKASGKLNSYLADVDAQAKEMFSRVVKQLAEKEGVTEKLKAENQMEWVGRMNNIHSRVVEVVNADLIHK